MDEWPPKSSKETIRTGEHYPTRHQLHGYARELYMDLDILGRHFTQLFGLSEDFASTAEIKSNLQEISALIVALKNFEHSSDTLQQLEKLKDETIPQIQDKLHTIKAQVNKTSDHELQLLGKSAIIVIGSHLEYLSEEVHKTLHKAKEQNTAKTRSNKPHT